MTHPPLQRGDIVSAWFPFTDLSMQKLRPALVLNRKKFAHTKVWQIVARQDASNRSGSHFGVTHFSQASVNTTDKSYPLVGINSPSTKYLFDIGEKSSLRRPPFIR